jgi:S1-C subfamily serine protease
LVSEEGSGFIVDKKGIVITANHVVVSNASHTKVQFYDRSEKNCCEVLHRDIMHDLAILEIENDNYQAIDLGTYETIKEGFHHNFRLVIPPTINNGTTKEWFWASNSFQI